MGSDFDALHVHIMASDLPYPVRILLTKSLPIAVIINRNYYLHVQAVICLKRLLCCARLVEVTLSGTLRYYYGGSPKSLRTGNTIAYRIVC